VAPGLHYEGAEEPLVFDTRDLFLVRRARANQADTEATFAALAAKWKSEAGTIASFPKKFMHPAYQDIVGLGPVAIGPILRELQRSPHYWFHALRHIAKYDPVKPEDRGNLKAMTEAWLEWGRDYL
jgi:hypothetical protein